MAYAALVAVCIFWGTTYLAIRIALESIPPLWLIGGRYVISGGILLFATRLMGLRMPDRKEFLSTAGCGVTCIGIGNGFLAISELLIPSGLAALFYTTSPFWMVGIDAVLPGGKRPLKSTVAGLLIGVFGVIWLIAPDARGGGAGGRTLLAFFLLQLSGIGWVLGSLLQKRVETRVHPIVTGAVQQLAAGVAVMVAALTLEHVPRAVTLRSEAAVAYLVTFGSIVGFSSFIYAMARLPVPIVSIYMFVNPLVAVILGWLFFREPFGIRESVAMLVIFAGVAVVRWSMSSARNPQSILAPEEIGALPE